MKLSRLFLPHFARGLIRAASVLGFAAALGLSQSANAGAFLFRKIADNSTAVPGGSGTFQTLGQIRTH